MAVEDGELSSESLTAYKAMKEEEQREFRQAQQVVEANKAKAVNDISTFGSLINTNITTNEGIGIVIPATEKEKFNAHVRGKIHYDDGKFYAIQEVNETNLPKILEAELFQFLGGDLKKLVSRKATTVATQRTIRRIAKDNTTTKGSESHSSKPATLGSIL